MTKKRTPSVYTMAVEQVQGHPHQEITEQESETEARHDVDEGIRVDRNLERTTLYLHPSQSNKLDTIALRFKKRAGKRINRSDIIRRLIDKYDIEQPL